jgi:hypothetical protein
MPDSNPCPGSAPAAAAGHTHLPGPAACPWPAVAGRTRLPLSVWPGIPEPACPALHPGLPPCLGAGAVPVIAAFSRPGDLVAVPGTPCAALAAAAARAGRMLGIVGIVGIVGIPGGDPRGSSCPAGQAALAVTAVPAGLHPGGDDALRQ